MTLARWWHRTVGFRPYSYVAYRFRRFTQYRRTHAIP